MIVTSMLSLFFGAVYASVITGLKMMNAANSREAIRLQLAHAMDRFTHEAVMTRNIDTATSTQFQFDADFNGDGSSLNANGETNINYTYQSNALTRQQGNNAMVTLVPNGSALTFSYLDSTGATLTPPITGSNQNNIRVVQLAMTGTKDAETLSVAGAACLRSWQGGCR